MLTSFSHFYIASRKEEPHNYSSNILFAEKNAFISITRFGFNKKWVFYCQIEPLLVSFFYKLSCCLCDLQIKETAVEFVIVARYFKLTQKGDHPTSKILYWFSRGVETYLFLKKPIRIIAIPLVSDKKETFFLPTAESSRIVGGDFFVSFISIIFNSSRSLPNKNNSRFAIGFARLFSFFFEKTVKHSQLLLFVGQLLSLLLQSSNNETLTLLGVRLQVTGRVGGSDRSKKHILTFGSVSKQSKKRFVDFGIAHALTPFGVCGIKVWFCHSQLLFFNVIAT